MSITKDRFMVQIITKDKTVGDELYAGLRRNQHDSNEAYPSPFVVALNDSAWACEIVATQEFVGVLEQFNSGDYPQALLDKGKSNAQIDGLRTVVFADYYDLYPDDGPRTLQEGALEKFIKDKGYSVQ